MPSRNLAALLKLPADERAELAMALWESLTDQERKSELELTDEQKTELDRRWAAHVTDPESAVPWYEQQSPGLGRQFAHAWRDR